MGKKILKKIRDTKGAFHAKMGTIKNRNGKKLTEAEEIEKTIQKNYTKEVLITWIATMLRSLT